MLAQPTVLMGVPQFFYRIYDQIHAKVHTEIQSFDLVWTSA